MKSDGTTHVERFWCQPDGSYQLDSHGFLRDPDAAWWGEDPRNSGVLRAQDLAEKRCLVLLGEPGAGKSSVLSAPESLCPEGIAIVKFDLAQYGSEDRLVCEVFEDPRIEPLSAGTDQLCLVLDSLDEARSRIPHIGAVVAQCLIRLPLDRLFVRIACRTADWPSSLARSLDEQFGEGLSVVELLPLRRCDARALAQSKCDSDVFLAEVDQTGAGPLAARPLTLLMLAREYGTSGRLPQRGAALFEAGIQALCEEQNEDRRDAGAMGELDVQERVAIARRIAAATVFSGAAVMWLGPVSDAGPDDLLLAALTGGYEPGPRDPIPVTSSSVNEVVATGLFASRGPQRLGWAHTTFADYLAGAWVVANQMTSDQVTSLFMAPDGRCWPQTRLAAAWAVAIAPDRFGFLTEMDPNAFQGEVELRGDGLRATVVEGLFDKASSLTAEAWRRPYRHLAHGGIVGQISAHLRDDDADRRRLAIQLADQCALVELRDQLVGIVLDPDLDSSDREAAGWALTRLPQAQELVHWCLWRGIPALKTRSVHSL